MLEIIHKCTWKVDCSHKCGHLYYNKRPLKGLSLFVSIPQTKKNWEPDFGFTFFDTQKMHYPTQRFFHRYIYLIFIPLLFYFTDLLSSEEFFSWSAFITITEPSPCMWQLCPNPMSSTNVLQRLEMIQLLWSFSRGSSNFCLEWGYLSMENTCIAGITFILDTRWPLSWHILSLKNVSIRLYTFFREIDFIIVEFVA